ncbi:MAG: sulfatase [Planctomycetaceae bacterium]|nr:sulfatase [Planctomycetaceae bacterium]
MLGCSSLGFGTLALAALCAESGRAASRSETGSPGDSLAPRRSQYAARAKSVIFLFLEGGVSQVESYDYKPSLDKYHGQNPREIIGELEKTQFAEIGRVLRSHWKFRRWGDSGLWASDLFPHTNRHMDDLCLIRSMTSKFPEHTGANYFLHSGNGLQGRPSLGSWATYGLGGENRNLPGFVVLNGGQIPSGGLDCFSSGFLPASYQGSLVNAIGTPVANIVPSEKIGGLQQTKRDLVRRLNRFGLSAAGKVDALESAITNYELAARMQLAVPDVMDLSDESRSTRQMYGLNADFKHTQTYARECLIARRLVERGVRFIELTVPMVNGYQRWDAHADMAKNHGPNALAVDQPIAALLTDLKQRGLWDETLIVCMGEFGRTPFAQGGSQGRDHNEHAFSMWLAGGGVKGGMAYGATDEWGYRTIENKLEIHDLHATILHLLGMDHTLLTYRFGGRDFRLTDIYGNVIEEILA